MAHEKGKDFWGKLPSDVQKEIAQLAKEHGHHPDYLGGDVGLGHLLARVHTLGQIRGAVAMQSEIAKRGGQ